MTNRSERIRSEYKNTHKQKRVLCSILYGFMKSVFESISMMMSPKRRLFFLQPHSVYICLMRCKYTCVCWCFRRFSNLNRKCIEINCFNLFVGTISCFKHLAVYPLKHNFFFHSFYLCFKCNWTKKLNITLDLCNNCCERSLFEEI